MTDKENSAILCQGTQYDSFFEKVKEHEKITKTIIHPSGLRHAVHDGAGSDVCFGGGE